MEICRERLDFTCRPARRYPGSCINCTGSASLLATIVLSCSDQTGCSFERPARLRVTSVDGIDPLETSRPHIA